MTTLINSLLLISTNLRIALHGLLVLILSAVAGAVGDLIYNALASGPSHLPSWPEIQHVALVTALGAFMGWLKKSPQDQARDIHLDRALSNSISRSVDPID